MKKLELTYLLCVFLCGCAGTPSSPPLTTQKFTTHIGVEVKTENGASIYYEGEFIPNEFIAIPEPVNKIMAGSMFMPTPVYIAGGSLNMKRIAEGWKYYCGKLSESSAALPGLGTIVEDGDCIGIRISIEDNSYEWVVDNSIYKRKTSILTRSMSDREKAQFTPQKLKTAFDEKQFVKINYNGFFGGQLHFTWAQLDSFQLNTQKFVFDFVGKPIVVSIMGKQFEITSADNVAMTYRWIKPN